MNSRDDNPAKPRRARADVGAERPRQIAERLYTAAFLAELQRQFGLDATRAETAARLRDIARRYILGRRTENQPELLKGDHRKYIELQKATENYLALLKQYEEQDIASDINVAAQQLEWPRPEPDDPMGYYRQLVLLLELLRTAAVRQAGYLASRGGRPKNRGLEDLTRHAADFWIGELGRPFRIDYHEGTGITLAFEFIKALVTPLDDVSDKQIVTAMRTEIAKRRSPGPPKARRKLTRT